MSPEQQAAEQDDLGLSIDMLDVDRLRNWAQNILTYGADLTHWASLPHVAGRLQILATNLEKAVRDIGQLRARLEACQAELASFQTAKGSNGEPLNAVPACPACGSTDGSLGTSNAYFTCRPCGRERYWTADHEHPGDWPTAVALSPFGRRSVLFDALAACVRERDEAREKLIHLTRTSNNNAVTAVDVAEQRNHALARAEQAEAAVEGLRERLNAACEKWLSTAPYINIKDSQFSTVRYSQSHVDDIRKALLASSPLATKETR